MWKGGVLGQIEGLNFDGRKKRTTVKTKIIERVNLESVNLESTTLYARFRAVLLNFLLSSFPLPNSPSLYISDVGEGEPQNKASRYTSSTLLRHHFPAFGKQDCFLLSCLPKVTLLSAFLLSFFSLKSLNSLSLSTSFLILLSGSRKAESNPAFQKQESSALKVCFIYI